MLLLIIRVIKLLYKLYYVISKIILFINKYILGVSGHTNHIDVFKGVELHKK